jgi:hypothetical protein
MPGFSRQKLHRAFELKEGTVIVLRNSNNNDNANLFYSNDFIQKLAYLVDMFEELSNLNKSIQDPHN